MSDFSECARIYVRVNSNFKFVNYLCLSVPISHFSSDFLLQYWGNVRDLGYIYLMFGNAPITGLGSQPATTLTRGSNFKVGAVNANPRPRPITPKTIRPYLLKTPPWKSLFFRFGTFTIQHSRPRLTSSAIGASLIT